LISAAYVVCSLSGAVAAETGSSVSGAIAEEPLARALAAFARQTGLQVVYVSADVSGAASPGAPAGLAAPEMLRRLLEGTDLSFQFINERTVRVFRSRRPSVQAETSAGKSSAKSEGAGAADNPAASNREEGSGAIAGPGLLERIAGFFGLCGDVLSTGSSPCRKPARVQRLGLPGSEALQEVLVTAERRAENAQNIPISVFAISGQELVNRQISTMDELAQVAPSFSDDSQTGGMFQNVNIRGIGQTALGSPSITPGVAIFRDGLLQGETTGLDVPLYDIGDVEVLEGPQGTLGGGSSVGGAIQINSTNPDFRGLHGFISTHLGNYSERGLMGALNLPIGESLALRIAFNHEGRGSFYSDVGANPDLGPATQITDPGNVDDTNGRLSVLWRPLDNFQALGKYEYSLDRSDGVAAEPITGSYTSLFNGASCSESGTNGSIVCPGAGVVSHSTFYYQGETPFVLDYASTNGRYSELEQRYLLDLRYTLPGAIVLRSLSGLQTLDVHLVEWNSFSSANDGTVYHELGPNDNYYSEELNLISPNTGSLRWVAGAFWFYRDTPIERVQPVYVPPYANAQNPIAVEYFGVGAVSRAAAVFANLDWQLSDTLQLQLGGRENWDSNFNFETPTTGVYQYPYVPPNTLPNTGPYCPATLPSGSKIGCISSSGEYRDAVPTGKVDLSWAPSAGETFYAFYARGYKSGGANGNSNSPNPTFRPETINDYEVGWKGQLLNHHIVTQTAMYWMRYQGMQYPIYEIDAPTAGNGNAVNLGPSTIKGIEASMQSTVGGLRWSFSVNYNVADLGGLTALNATALPNNTVFRFDTATAPVQCPTAASRAGCFNYVPYEQSLSGEEMPFAPRLTVHSTIDYGLPVGNATLQPRMEFSYVTSEYASIFESPYYYMGPRRLLGADLAYLRGNYAWTLYGTNLLNAIYLTGNDGTNQYYGPPRQWGMRFDYKFGGE
jgi:iron complex outermembrane receptor protein